MPPFRVVNANKAFSIFCDGRVPGDIIGKPVESIVQVLQDIAACPTRCSSSDKPEILFDSHLPGPDKACRIKVTPVMDHSRKGRDGMSHLLIQIHSPANKCIAAPRATKELSDAVSQVDLKHQSIQQNSHVLGTVG